MIIRHLTPDQEKPLRYLLVADRVYVMVHDTLRSMKPEMTDLSQVEIWLAAQSFTDTLLNLPDAEELLADEVEDLRREAEGKNDAVLIMTTSICQLAAMHQQKPEADQLIKGLLPYCHKNPLYASLLEKIDGKEQQMILAQKGVDLLRYEMQRVEVEEGSSDVMASVFDTFIDNSDNMTAQTAESTLLMLNLLNLQEKHKYDDKVLKAFEKLKYKVNVRPEIVLENGDYVLKKEIQNQVNGVEEGGIGINVEKK